jgi:hypothetical protein
LGGGDSPERGAGIDARGNIAAVEIFSRIGEEGVVKGTERGTAENNVNVEKRIGTAERKELAIRKNNWQ